MSSLVGMVIAWLVALLQLAAAANLQVPAEGELDLVFPRNETYAVVSPFPIIFAFQNPQVMLNFGSELYYEVRCDLGSLYGIQRIAGGVEGRFSSDTFYAINTTKTNYEAIPESLRDPDGPYGYWHEGDVDNCTLEWEFGYLNTCEKQSDGSIDVKGGGRGSKGRVAFTLKPGAPLPQNVLADYTGCPVPIAARKIDSLPISTCPDVGEQPGMEPCQVDVRVAASSLVRVIAMPTTTFMGMPTSITAPGRNPTVTSEGNDGSGNANESAASSPFTNSVCGLALVVAGFGVFNSL